MAELRASQVYFRDHLVPFEEATLSIASSAVLYGLSTYTVFPVFWNQKSKQLQMFRLHDHFTRLQRSAKILAFDDFLERWDFNEFEAAMRQLLTENKITADSLVRVTVFVDAILGGTKMRGLPHELAAFVYPAVALLPAKGAHLCVSSWRRTPDNAIPARAKINGSYVNASLMKHEAIVNGFDDAIALDEQGHVAESTVANIFIVRDGKLITPSSSTDLLEGITRDTVFKMADELGIVHEQRNIDRSELYIADEAFLCGSSMRLTPILSVDKRVIGEGIAGEVTKQLQRAYQEHGASTTKLHPEWLAPV